MSLIAAGGIFAWYNLTIRGPMVTPVKEILDHADCLNL